MMYGSEPGCAQPPLLRWGVDNTQHAGSIILSQIPGITKVILAAVSSLLGDQGRGNDIAMVTHAAIFLWKA